MTSIKSIRTLAVVAGLLLAPMIAAAGTMPRTSATKTLAVVDGGDVAALRCKASAARSEMTFLTCLAGCARRITDASPYDSKCEQGCIDRRGARDEGLSCQFEENARDAGVPEETAPGLAQTQALPRKLTYSQRHCYWTCRVGKMSIAFCQASCF